MHIKRGQVYFVNLDPVLGHEIGGGKRRPVVVLSINQINRKPLVITVVPGTKAAAKPARFRNVVTVTVSPANGLSTNTVFQCHQLRALDHQRFPTRPAGYLEPADLERIENAVRFSLGLI